MAAFFIDREGKLVGSGSPELRSHGPGGLSETELHDLVARELGFVRIDTHEHGIRVRFDPSRVAGPTAAALLYELARRRPRRVVIGHLGETAGTSVIGDHWQALEHVSALLDQARRERERRFIRTPAAIRLAPGHPLHDLLAVWRDLGGKLDRDRLAPVLDGPVAKRYAMARIDGGGERVELAEVGGGYDPVALRWFVRGRDMRLEDQADQAYGAWLAETYREVARTGEPKLDAVDATLVWARTETRRYRYTRLILPFSTATGQVVISASTRDWTAPTGSTGECSSGTETDRCAAKVS